MFSSNLKLLARNNTFIHTASLPGWQGLGRWAIRCLSQETVRDIGETTLRRSYLYVPSSNQRMLEKSIQSPSDMVIYDLEDSVAPSQKDEARSGLERFLSADTRKLPPRERIAVRINATTTSQFEEDMEMIGRSKIISTIVVPKVNSPQDLEKVASRLPQADTKQSTNFVASIESPQALWNIGEIASWRTSAATQKVALSALLFAAEDYCASTSIMRTATRQELLYTRSKIVAAAKAFRLDAIDMVCIHYKDESILLDECEDGRRLGFDGKQAIHPSQLKIVQNVFVPTQEEVHRASSIVHRMELSHKNKQGAFGLDDGKGGKEMIDAPMLKQAYNILRKAKAAGLALSHS